MLIYTVNDPFTIVVAAQSDGCLESDSDRHVEFKQNLIAGASANFDMKVGTNLVGLTDLTVVLRRSYVQLLQQSLILLM